MAANNPFQPDQQGQPFPQDFPMPGQPQVGAGGSPWQTGAGSLPQGGGAQPFPNDFPMPGGGSPQLGSTGGPPSPTGPPPPTGPQPFGPTAGHPTWNVDKNGQSYDANGKPIGNPVAGISGTYVPQTQQPTNQGPVTNGGYNDIPGLFNKIFQGIPQSPYQQQLNDAIMRTLQQNSQPVTASDPMLQAIQGQAQRAQDYNRSIVGERLYGQGVPSSSGAWDNAVSGFNQQSQESTQNQLANVIQQRQQNIMQALSLGSQYLTSQQTQQLQSALQQLNAILGNSQFYNQLGTQAGEFAQNQNQQGTQSLL